MDQLQEKNAINPQNIKQGNIMAFVNYVKVDEVSNEGKSLIVSSLDDGNQIKVEGEELIKGAESADLFDKTESVTMTKAAEILISSYNRPFTVVFEKQDGTDRTLRGRLVHPEHLLGRSMVEDLDLPFTDKNRLRLVDHRTISMIIVNGVKYEVKNSK